MAQDAYLTDNPEALDISRQRKLAEMLTLKAFEQPQGNMISGHYVAPSWTQQLAPLASGIAGQAMGAKLDEKQLKLAEALRAKQTQQIEQYGELEKTDKAAALRYALGSDNPILRDIAKEELKGITLNEGAIHQKASLSGGTTELKGNAKYHAPTSVDMGTLGTMLIYPDGRREMVQKGREGPAGQVLETDNGPMLINTRTGQAQPIMANGQPLTGAGKPLTEVQGKATSFGGSALEGNNIMKSLEDKGFDPSTFYNQSQITAARTGAIGNKLSSPEAQQYQNAMDLFGNNYLRYQSGANMPPKEIQENLALMTPRMGDSKEKLIQKANARLVAIKGMESSAGPAGTRQMYKNTTQGQNSSTVTPSIPKPATNLQFDPALLQYMTPEQRKLFGA